MRQVLRVAAVVAVVAACVPSQSGSGGKTGSAGGGSGRWDVNLAKNGEWSFILPSTLNQGETYTSKFIRASGQDDRRPGYIIYMAKSQPDWLAKTKYFNKWGVLPLFEKEINLDVPPPADAEINKDAIVTSEKEAEARRRFKTAFDLYQAGDYRSAATAFEEGFEFNPNDGVARFYYADAVYHLELYELAARDYTAATVLAPGTPEAVRAKTILNSFYWDESGGLKTEIVSAIREHCIWAYSVPDQLNRHKQCGFPSGKSYFTDDLYMIGAGPDQRAELERAFDNEVETYDWKADCRGFYDGVLSPKHGNASIPWLLRMEQNCPLKLYYIDDFQFKQSSG